MLGSGRFAFGSRVEMQLGGVWLPGEVTFVWRGVDCDSGRKLCAYNVAGTHEDGRAWAVNRVPESELRRRDPRRGRRRVLRAHSVNRDGLT